MCICSIGLLEHYYSAERYFSIVGIMQLFLASTCSSYLVLTFSIEWLLAGAAA